MVDRSSVERTLAKHGFEDVRWTSGKDVVVNQWVRMKCMYGCGEYGRSAACPPNVPSIRECRGFFDEYEQIAIIHVTGRMQDPEDRHAWSHGINAKLAEAEREVFLAGNRKTFLLFMDSCHMCGDCTGNREECRQPRNARPAPEALGVDVYATVRSVGFYIEVLQDYCQEMNRYAFLLVE